MRNLSRTTFGQLLLAYLTVSLTGGAAFAQSIDNQIPGLGANTPPKVMIIFDTSKSMQHLPQSDLVNDNNPLMHGDAIAYANSHSGNYFYLQNDWDPASPTDECLNRFCIAKKVLYNVLPTYSDDIQAGLSGYYQYRTQYTPPGGTTQCLYDVLAAPNVMVPFQSSNSTLGGTTIRPPGTSLNNCYVRSSGASYVSDPSVDLLHRYLIDGGSNPIIGSTDTCSTGIDYGSFLSASSSTRVTLSNHGCSNTDVPLYTRSDVPAFRNGAISPASNIFVRFGTGTLAAGCGPYATKSLRYTGRNGSNNDLLSTTVGTNFPSLINPLAATTEALGGKLVFSELSGVLTPDSLSGFLTCTASKPCDLVFTGLNTRLDATRSTVRVAADAGDEFTYAGRTFSRDAGAPDTKWGTRTYTDGGGCTFHDGTPAAPGDSTIFTGTAAALSAPTGYTMSLPTGVTTCVPGSTAWGSGCRIEMTGSMVLSSTASTWTLPPMAPPTTTYRVSPPTPPSYVCANGSTEVGTWGANLPTGISVNGSAATGYGACTNVFGYTTGTLGGQPVSGAAGCSATTPCDFYAGDAGWVTAPITRYSPTTPAVPAGYIDGGVVNFDVLTLLSNNYTGACPSANVGDILNDTGTYFSASGCNGTTPCQLSYIGFIADAGNVPSVVRHSPYILPFSGGTDDAGFPITYHYSGLAGTDTGLVAQLAEEAGGCPSVGTEATVTSGTYGTVTCSVAAPCTVKSTSTDTSCYRAGDLAPTSCAAGSDSTVLRKCNYGIHAYTYVGDPFGICQYQRQKFNLAYPTCTYQRPVRVAVPPATTCTTLPGLTCNYRLVSELYSYADSRPYCEAYVKQFSYTGTAGNVYDYSYYTKGGEYLGSITLPNGTRPQTSFRNWCEVGTYAPFGAECPQQIDDSNAASFSGTGSACTGGRVCKLRWRSGLTSDAGVLYGKGRLSYDLNAYLSQSESYNPSTPYSATSVRCLAPDRDGGEVESWGPQTLMLNESVSTPLVQSASSGFPVVNRTTVQNTAYNLTVSNLELGATYRVSWTASQAARVGGADTQYYAAWAPAGGSGTTAVCPVSTPTACTINAASTATTTNPVTGAAYSIYTTPQFGAQTESRLIRIDNDAQRTLNFAFMLKTAWNCPTCAAPNNVRKLSVNNFTIEKVLTNFCAGIGVNAPTQVRLRSDWYDPGQPSNESPFIDVSTNQATRNSGWSQGPDGGPSDIFVPLAIGNIGPIQQALGRCVRPNDLSSPATGGLCTSDTDNCGPLSNSLCQDNDAGMTDFTPLYGSLKNAHDYLRNELANDNVDQYECRDYYVLLVTDGLESTPRNFTQSNLQSVVSAMRSTTVSGRTKDIRTFVIGFGSGLSGGDAGLSDVDVIARAGGTALKLNPLAATLYDTFIYDNTNGRALAATNDAELTQTLNWVFSAISAGRFARTRPTISSDGKRIYQAYFDRGDVDDAGTPELLGNMLAFRVETNGSLTQMWEYRPKLDAQLPSSRNLSAILTLSDGGMTTTNFVSTNAALTSYMNELWGGGTDAGAAIVSFVRNDTLGQAPEETYAPIPVPRTTRAGAIMFSTPVAVGPPPFNAMSYGGNTAVAGNPADPSKDSYAAYKAQRANREQRVVFGSNDGILRGLYELSDAGACVVEADAGCPNGSEAWGFIPSEALAKLQSVRGGGARPVVDGTTAVADVCFHNATDDAKDCVDNEWRTVAISTMRHGGQAIFALDMTDGGVPTPLWQFADQNDVDGDDLGLTYSVPSIGRVSFNGGVKRWVAFMGAGLSTNAGDGDSFYILDMKTGRPSLGSGIAYRTKFENVLNSNESFAGRIAMFKPVFPTTSADVDTVYMGDNVGQLWMARTRDTSFPRLDWRPEPLFTANVSTDAVRADRDARLVTNPTEYAPIWKVNKATLQRCVSGDACYLNCSLPLGSATVGPCSAYNVVPRMYNRPKIDMKYDVTLVKPDIFIGTGDTQNITSSGAVNDRDFIFALHDNDYDKWRGNQPAHARIADAAHAPKVLWAYALDQGERVLGEPAFIGGSVVFASYMPPANGCRTFGDGYLYAFEPRTGAPRQSLLDPATGIYKSVVKLTGSGPISDLISMNGNIYYATASNPSVPQFVQTRQTGLGGRVHGWRRVR